MKKEELNGCKSQKDLDTSKNYDFTEAWIEANDIAVDKIMVNCGLRANRRTP